MTTDDQFTLVPREERLPSEESELLRFVPYRSLVCGLLESRGVFWKRHLENSG